MKTRTPVRIDPCEESELFEYSNSTKTKMYGIDKYMCPNTTELNVTGNYYSETFKYIEVKLKKCDNQTGTCLPEEQI